MASDLEKAVSNINDAATKANITTDFFTAVLDGNESQTIKNPVSGKSCPSLKKQINDRFTADSSQLNSLLSQATSQADIAKREADRASQIAGLDTVEQAVGLAAIPFPDVWIPLNDNLRMIAGVGDDIKVGGYSVATNVLFSRASGATYIDKSGILRLASINEPRFEKEGVLIEGMSANLIAKTEGLTSSDFSVSSGATLSLSSRIENGITIYTAEVSGSASDYTIDLRYGDYSDRSELATVSMLARIISGSDNVFLKGATVSESKVLKTQKMLRYSHSESVGTQGYRYIGLRSSSPFSVEFCAMQGELLPFATSYIPTYGSTATRAADFMKYPREGNDNYFGENTISVEVHTTSDKGTSGIEFTSKNRKGILSAYPSTGAHQMIYLNPRDNYPLFCYGTTDASGGKCSVLAGDTGRHNVVSVFDGFKNSCFTDGVKGDDSNDATPVFGVPNDENGKYVLIGYGAGSTNSRHLFGHIRNIRVWNIALTDSQIKGIK